MQESNPPAPGQTYHAFAKINLSLEILNKRPDGYHELTTVMQTVGLFDVLRVELADDLEFDCNLPELVEENNLVWQAALAMHGLCEPDRQRGARIYLEKNIPVAAGLGGGSSDGATTLVALNRLWKLDLSEQRLQEIAAGLGSDVPFFVRGGTALAEGRGETLTPLPLLPETWMVLLHPQLELPANKTAELYKLLNRRDFTGGEITRALVASIRRGELPPQSLLYNNFEQVVYERFPQLDMFRQVFVESGAEYVRVSGSGPTLFTMLSGPEEARQIADKLDGQGLQAFAVPTVQPEQ